jgi:hypothetical protein
MTRDRLQADEPTRLASASRGGPDAGQTGSRTGNGSLARARRRSGAASFGRRDPAPAGSCPARADRSRPRARQRSRGWAWASAHPDPANAAAARTGAARELPEVRRFGAGPTAAPRAASPAGPMAPPDGGERASARERPEGRPSEFSGPAQEALSSRRGASVPQRTGGAAMRRPRVRQASQSSERVSAREPLRWSQPGYHGCHAGRCPSRARFGVLERGSSRRVAVEVGGEAAIGKGLRSPDGKRPRHQGSREGPGATGACPRNLCSRMQGKRTPRGAPPPGFDGNAGGIE